MKLLFAFLFCTFWLDNEKMINSESTDKIEQIEIRCTDIGSMTEMNVDCSRFENAFGNSIKAFRFNDNKTIDKLVSYLDDAVIDTHSNSIGIDTRIKVFITYRSNKVDSLCI